MLHGFLLFVHVVVCLILIAVILLQAGRGGGLSETFGGGAAQSILGTRGAAYLTRATTAFAVVFMLTSLGLAILSAERSKSLLEGRVLEPEEIPAKVDTPQAPPAGQAGPLPEEVAESGPAAGEEPQAGRPDEEGTAPSQGAPPPAE